MTSLHVYSTCLYQLTLLQCVSVSANLFTVRVCLGSPFYSSVCHRSPFTVRVCLGSHFYSTCLSQITFYSSVCRSSSFFSKYVGLGAERGLGSRCYSRCLFQLTFLQQVYVSTHHFTVCFCLGAEPGQVEAAQLIHGAQVGRGVDKA